jgi:hypothetical protein
MIDRARRVVVVADSSKIGHVAFATICPLEAVTLVITDTDADPRAVKAIEELGPEVHLVPVRQQDEFGGVKPTSHPSAGNLFGQPGG